LSPAGHFAGTGPPEGNSGEQLFIYPAKPERKQQLMIVINGHSWAGARRDDRNAVGIPEGQKFQKKVRTINGPWVPAFDARGYSIKCGPENFSIYPQTGRVDIDCLILLTEFFFSCLPKRQMLIFEPKGFP